MNVTHIELANDGWLLEFETGEINGTVHLNKQWCQDMYLHQIKPNQTPNPAFNRLCYQVKHGASNTRIADTFAEAYGAILKDRQDRSNLGLKAVTKDGYEDLKAVGEGAPVRPWNAEHEPSELKDFIGRRRADRNK